MKFIFENLGLLEKAELDLAQLTIICGENNTGKTYATYAIYGFLRNWKDLLYHILAEEVGFIDQKDKKYRINLEEIFTGNINYFLNKMSKLFIQDLPRVFASKEEAFIDTKITINIDKEISIIPKSFNKKIQIRGEVLATITKDENSPILEVLADDGVVNTFGINGFIFEAISEIVFSQYFPNPHISSAERTGAAIFRKELDIARTRMLKALHEMGNKEIKRIKERPWELLREVGADYAWPVEDNVDFVRQLEDLDKQKSELSKSNPEILLAFDDIIGGSYKVLRNQGLVFHAKKGKQRKFTMNEASSCVRSLLDVGFYLRCRAKKGDFFIIDEPELNLHPKNQRAFARLVARLINAGVSVFMTTHSDYLIKELNTLIMMNQDKGYIKEIKEKYEYANEEIVNPSMINLYITRKKSKNSNKNVLIKASIHSDVGIEVSTFDDTIDIMNEIQEALLYGGEL